MKSLKWIRIVQLFTIIITVSMLISCSDDNEKITEPENTGPVIDSITANPPGIKFNETTVLTCYARDADGGEKPLDHGQCGEAFRAAVEFYARHFPEWRFKFFRNLGTPE